EVERGLKFSRGLFRSRPADVETWLASIEEALTEPAAAPAPEPAEQGSTSTPRARRRPRLILAAVLVVLGLAAGLGIGEQIWHDQIGRASCREREATSE